MSETVPPTSLSARVAEEIRVVLTRQRKSQRALADDLRVSVMWVNGRVNCETEMSLNDLERVAAALGVAVADLIPADAIAGIPAVAA
jgi:transcriptional regulator with XRE-family HTH domain